MFNNNQTIDKKYLNVIDTDEKAYILGLVSKNNHYVMALNQRRDIREMLENICVGIYTNIIYINDDEILNSIKTSIKNFINLSDECKKGFIRGLYEVNYETIIISDIIKDIIDDIKDYILKDIKYDIIKNENNEDVIIFNNNYNKNKFLKKLYYSNDNITLFNSYYKNKILNEHNPTIKVYKSHKDAVIPAKAFEEDAGYDLTIISKIKDFNSKTSLYDTGIKIEVDEGYYTEIIPRSSISKFGYILANNVGIIDNHYRGNLMIALTKIADDAPEIVLPFKCCQLIVKKQIFANLCEITDDNLSSTVRNDGGFGSTS
jgi:deoxyuridine 5'-triphosphate nucleotidohydrolase